MQTLKVAYNILFLLLSLQQPCEVGEVERQCLATSYPESFLAKEGFDPRIYRTQSNSLTTTPSWLLSLYKQDSECLDLPGRAVKHRGQEGAFFPTLRGLSAFITLPKPIHALFLIVIKENILCFVEYFSIFIP